MVHMTKREVVKFCMVSKKTESGLPKASRKTGKTSAILNFGSVFFVVCLFVLYRNL